MNTLNLLILVIVAFSTLACSSASMRGTKIEDQRSQFFTRESTGGLGRH